MERDFGAAISAIEKAINSIPSSVPGIYKMLNDTGAVLYVGKARDLKSRIRSYLNLNQMSERILVMLSQISALEVMVTESEAEALLLEARLIKAIRPKYNIVMRDDKFYPYIEISRHKYPRISKRRMLFRSEKDCYGPFMSSLTVKHIISAIRKVFRLRPCSDSFFVSRDRACIEYEMQNCSAPCVNKISEKEYADMVHMARKVLTGRGKDLQRELLSKMREFSKNLEYENAIVYRDRLQAIRSMQECAAFSSGFSDADFVSLYRRKGTCCVQIISIRGGIQYGCQPYFMEISSDVTDNEVLSMFVLQMYDGLSCNKVYVDCTQEHCATIATALKELSRCKVEVLCPESCEEIRIINTARNGAMEALNHSVYGVVARTELEELAMFFGLSKVPERVEIYDNSHISGTHPFGVMVVCGRNGLLKREYKKFPIETVCNGDDYAMMHEVISRRFSDDSIPSMPDFVLIDGGRGHISSVMGKLSELQIPFACIAKGLFPGGEVFYLADGEKLFLDKNSRLMLYMRMIRDEAHRFAITSHRKSRNNSFLPNSVFNSIPGVGRGKKLAIITYFGSIDAIKCAKVEEISRVPGIGLKLAERIVEHIKNS